MRTRSWMLVLAMLTLAQVAHAADPRKTWHGVIPDDPPGFDPAGESNSSASIVLELVFDRLLTYDYLARSPKLVPLAAAAMPEVSPDGLTRTVRIRQGIYVSLDPAFTGLRRELTASDFVDSFKRFLDPGLRSPSQFLFREKFIGLDEFARAAGKSGRFECDAPIEGLRALDRYTLRFKLKKRDHRFGYLLAHNAACAVAREVVERYGEAIALHPVGSGPYALTSWIPGTKAVLDANPAYRGFVWDFAPSSDPRDLELVAQMRGKHMPQIGHIELAAIEEGNPHWLAFLNRDLDVASINARYETGALANGTLRPDLGAKGITMYRDFSPWVTYAAFNFRDPIVGGFSRAKLALRRAIAMAFDANEEVRVLYHGNATRSEMLIPPNIYGYDAGYRSSVRYDPDMANTLLDRFGYARDASGYRRTPKGEPIVLLRNTSYDSWYRDLDKLWQTSMKRIGLRMAFRTLTAAELSKASRTCTIPLLEYGWAADYPDGENFMQLLYGPNTQQSNPGCYQSAGFDRLYEKAEALPDGPERARVFVEMTRQMEADTAMVPEVVPGALVLLHPWVEGHKLHPILNTVVQYVDVKSH